MKSEEKKSRLLTLLGLVLLFVGGGMFGNTVDAVIWIGPLLAQPGVLQSTGCGFLVVGLVLVIVSAVRMKD